MPNVAIGRNNADIPVLRKRFNKRLFDDVTFEQEKFSLTTSPPRAYMVVTYEISKHLFGLGQRM